MISGSRALEFLVSQGCTTLGNLVLARRDALLADVRGTVPAEEVARLRYSPLPQSAAIFPHALLDSSSSPSSHTGIVSDVPGRLSSGSSLAARG